jgi:hypothetical protein
MTIQEVEQMAMAIAAANGHPEPAAWARLVVENYVPAAPPVVEKALFEPKPLPKVA